MNSNSVVIKYLESKGYSPRTGYYGYIELWREWYENEVSKFHEYHDQNGEKREIYKLGMAKRGCEDWSSILFSEKDKLICSNQDNQDYLDKELDRMHFDEVIPENIEEAFWSGTCGTITRVKNAILNNNELSADDKTSFDLINVSADMIIPLRVEHKKIIDVAFVSTIQKEQKNYYYIEIHELKEDGYIIKNVYVDESGNETEFEGVLKEYYTHSNIPLFNLFSPRIVNNLKNKNGLGISIYANAIDQLKGCDLAYNNFLKDIELGGKKVFYNKKLVKYVTKTYTDEKSGEKVVQEIPIYPDDITKQQFQVLGDEISNANDESLIHEYNPSLRADEDEKIINLNLNLYSFKIGLGKSRYKFENGTVVTATQYVGENQDLVQNAKKHRNALNEYMVGIARSILLLGKLLYGYNLDENDVIELTNKDGFLVSDEDLQNQYRQDLNSGLMSKLTYLMKARGMTLEQAQQELALAREDNPQLSDLIGE